MQQGLAPASGRGKDAEFRSRNLTRFRTSRWLRQRPFQPTRTAPGFCRQWPPLSSAPADSSRKRIEPGCAWCAPARPGQERSGAGEICAHHDRVAGQVLPGSFTGSTERRDVPYPPHSRASAM